MPLIAAEWGIGMSIAVIGASFVDIKGFPSESYIPNGRNKGWVEYIHGGVARNVVEDIANMELRPTYVSIVDDTPLGTAVVQKLKKHKVDVDYVMTRPDGMGTWLAVFDNNGDVAGSISKRPNMLPLLELLEERGDELFRRIKTVVIEVDIEKEIMKKVFQLVEKHQVRMCGLVSNMSIAVERRDFIQRCDCFICNLQEAGLLFLDDFSGASLEKMRDILSEKVVRAQIPAMIVTMGAQGAVYADRAGGKGASPARNVQVKDTTGAGDAFCAGVAAGLTYGKTLGDSVEIGSALAAAVITSSENVCPRFRPEEFGLEVAWDDTSDDDAE